MTSASHGFRTLAVGVLAPLLIAIAGVLVAMALAASGPRVVVTHWGVSGQPDQLGSPYIYPILIAAVSVAVIAFLGGSAVLVAHRSPMTPMIKLIGVTSLWVTVFLGVGLVFYLLTSRERIGWLKHWQIWAGGVLALALFSPVVWVDSQRNWISFRYQTGRSNFADQIQHPLEFVRFLIEESVQLLPTLYIFMIIGVVLFFMRRARPLALPLLTSAPMVAYFLADAWFGRVNPNWTAPLFPQLALIGAWAAITIRPRAAWLRWPLDLLYVLHVPLGLALMLFAYVSIDTRTVPFLGPVQAFDFVYGWDGLWAKVSALAKASGAQWVDAPNYSFNGWLGYYGRIAHDPLPVLETSEPFRYDYMPKPDPALLAAPHLLFFPDGYPAPAGAEPLGIVTRDLGGTVLASYQIYLVK